MALGGPAVLKKRLDRSGVSEVVGTILVLLITVIIFSSIIVWVYTIPSPRSTGRVSIDGELTGVYSGGVWGGAYINLTHKGGDDLFAGSTRIIITVNNTTQVLRTKGSIFDGVSIKEYGIEGADATWSIGETWSYFNETIPEGATVSAMVVDLDKGLVLWDKVLLGAAGEQAPVFIDKWVDSDPTTDTRDAVREGDKFAIYAKIIDPDQDLNPQSVWAYLTFGSNGTPLGYVQLVDNGDANVGDKVAGDGIYSRSLSYKAQKAWDGGIIVLNATDNAGHQSKTRITLSIAETGTVVVAAKGPGSLTLGSDLQRFDIFNETEWEKNKYNANSTRTFKKGETVVVVVASKYLPNLDLENSFKIYDVTTTPTQAIVYGNPPYNDPVSSSSVPSSTGAFTFLEFLGGFYVYTYSFNTNSSTYGFDGVQLAYGNYPIEISLKASAVDPPKNRFYATDYITITDDEGNAPSYPRILFFKDAGHTQPTTNFKFTDTLYVVLEVKSTDGTFEIGDVVIQDFLGGIQVWAQPGNTPVSTAAINNSGLDLRRYTFSVDLSTPNMDSWLFGNNSYSFLIRTFTDLDESYSYLTVQINITGPLWLLDIMNAIREFKNPMGQKFYGYFYRNDRAWQKTAYEVFDSTPQEQDPKWGKGPFFSIAMGDLDGDGDLDAVVGIKSGGVLVYRNLYGDGSNWRRIVVDTNAGGEVRSVAAGDVDMDGDDDVVAGTEEGKLWLYKNDGYWTPTLLDSQGWYTSLRFADVDGDGDLDLVAGNQDKKVRVYFNDGTGIFGTTLVDDYFASQETTSVGSRSGSLSDTQSANDVYEVVSEAVVEGISFTEVVQDGTFLSDLSAWPTEVLTKTQGQTSWDSDSATNDGSGSLRAENTLGDDTKFAGYREQSLSNTIAPGTNYTLTLRFRKSWTGAAPDVQKQGVALRYQDGTVEVLWEDSFVMNSGSWTELRIDGVTQTGHGDVVAIRLTFDIDGTKGTNNQAKVWFDDVSIKEWSTDGQASRLEHKWVFNNIGGGGTSYRLKIQAHHSPNLENDDFEVYYSLDDKAYIRMLTVTKTADDDSYQAYVLPSWIGGNTVYVKVLDTVWSNGTTSVDTLSVDHLVIQRIIIVTPNSISVDLGSEIHAIDVGDIDADGDVDIVAGLDNAKVPILLNSGSGTSWSRVDVSSTNIVWSVGLGDFDGDGDLDIAAGTEDKKVHVYYNSNGAGTSWTTTTLEEDVGGKVLALDVGDVNGDGWVDVVIGTQKGNVYYYRNRAAQGWDRTEIDFVKKDVYGVALGDVDRGIVPGP